jgi:hypothetical protein
VCYIFGVTNNQNKKNGMKFFKTLKAAQNNFNKIGTPKCEEAFYLVQITEGANNGKYVVTEYNNLIWGCYSYNEIEVKL